MASQPPIPRSMPAGEKEPQQPAQEGVRRSGRVRKNTSTCSNPETVHRQPREGDRGTPGPRNKSPARSWGEMSSSESTSSFSSRVVATLREYEDAGKALTQLKEELREARVLNTRASNKERPATSQRFKALRDEMVRAEDSDSRGWSVGRGGGRRTAEGDPTAGVSSGPDAVFLRGGRSSGAEKKEEEDGRSRTGGEEAKVVMSEVEHYSEASGSKVNQNKCESLWLGGGDPGFELPETIS